MYKQEQLLTVIIPVYNVEKYINKCLESIINQTYKNLEIILVDDGSTDNSSYLCDEWQKKDSRITVIHKKMVVYQMLEMQDCKLQKEN